MRFSLAFFLGLCLLGMGSLQAQHAPALSLGFSLNSYRGDLDHPYAPISPGLQAGIWFQQKEKLNGHVLLEVGQLRGDEPDFHKPEESTALPNTYFQTNFVALSYNLRYNILKTERWNIYLSQGIGLFRFQPLDESKNRLIDQAETRETGESYSNQALHLPTRLGLRYRLPNNWRFYLQAGTLNPLSDYIDNISQAGSKKGNDRAWQLSLGLQLPLQIIDPEKQP